MPSWCTTKGGHCRTLNVVCGYRSFWTRCTQPRSVSCLSGLPAVVAAPAALAGVCQELVWPSTRVPQAAHYIPNPLEAPRTCPLSSGWTRRRAPTCHKRPTSHRHTKMAAWRRLARRRRKAGPGKGGKERSGREERAHSGGGWKTSRAAASTWSGGLCSAFRGHCIKRCQTLTKVRPLKELHAL